MERPNQATTGQRGGGYAQAIDSLRPGTAAPSDYQLLFELVMRTFDFLDQCRDPDALIDAGDLFDRLCQMADQQLAEVWAER